MALKSMTDAIKNVSKKTGVSKDMAQGIIESFLCEVGDTLEAGDSLVIKGFGTFSMKKYASRAARNIRTGEAVIIPERNKAHFKPSKNFNVYAAIHKL